MSVQQPVRADHSLNTWASEAGLQRQQQQQQQQQLQQTPMAAPKQRVPPRLSRAQPVATVLPLRRRLLPECDEADLSCEKLEAAATPTPAAAITAVRLPVKCQLLPDFEVSCDFSGRRPSRRIRPGFDQNSDSSSSSSSSSSRSAAELLQANCRLLDQFNSSSERRQSGRKRQHLPDSSSSSSDEGVDCAEPPAKSLAQRRRTGSGNGAGIATNPRYRRRSRDWQAAVAAVAAVTPRQLPEMKDAQTSPILLNDNADTGASRCNTICSSSSTSTTTTCCSSSARGARQQQQQQQHRATGSSSSSSSGGWARSAKRRIDLIRRSLSSSRLETSASRSPASNCGSGSSTPRRPRKRQSSLQRLVQRLAPSPKSMSSASSASGAAAPAGCVLHLHRDGSRTVRLQRAEGNKFGFFVARRQDGVYLTRFNDPSAQARYLNLIGVDDKILEIEGRATDGMELNDIYKCCGCSKQLTMRVLPKKSSW